MVRHGVLALDVRLLCAVLSPELLIAFTPYLLILIIFLYFLKEECLLNVLDVGRKTTLLFKSVIFSHVGLTVRA
jgi:hypothetical protein